MKVSLPPSQVTGHMLTGQHANMSTKTR